MFKQHCRELSVVNEAVLVGVVHFEELAGFLGRDEEDRLLRVRQ